MLRAILQDKKKQVSGKKIFLCRAHTASLSLVGCHSLLDSDTANWLQQRATDAQQGAMKTLSAHIHTERTHGRKVLLSCTQGTTNLKSQRYF